MIEFGTERSIITTYRNSEVVKTFKQFRIRIRVRNAQEEMSEYIRFTKEIAEARANGSLVCEESPTFTIEYPRDKDAPYFVIKSYCIVI